MTFATLTPNTKYIRDREVDSALLKNISDADLVKMQIDSVRGDFTRDVCRALHLEPGVADTTAVLDEAATTYKADLEIALTLLQLAYIYGGRAYGTLAGVNAEKAKQYRTEYKEAKNCFSSLAKRATGQTRTRFRVRRF